MMEFYPHVRSDTVNFLEIYDVNPSSNADNEVWHARALMSCRCRLSLLHRWKKNFVDNISIDCQILLAI
jgi:hypothetical protein